MRLERTIPGEPAKVNVMLAADVDGDGPEGKVLVVGGEFEVAGGAPARNGAIWNGETWRQLGYLGDIPFSPTYSMPAVSSLLMYNGELVLGLALWTSNAPNNSGNVYHRAGDRWVQIGTGGPKGVITSMVKYNGDLIASGALVMRWDGQAWTEIAATYSVLSLQVHEGVLYAAGYGSFPAPADGGPTAMYVATWDGANWRPVSNNSMSVAVMSLLSTPDGLMAAHQATGGHICVSRLTPSGWTPHGCQGLNAEYECGSTARLGNAITCDEEGRLFLAGQVIRREGTPGSQQTGGGAGYLRNGIWTLDPGAPASIARSVAAYNHQVVVGTSQSGGLARFSFPTADFNHDGAVGDDGDITAFFSCLSGLCCPNCSTSDFDGAGDIGTDADIEAFFRLLAGQPC